MNQQPKFFCIPLGVAGGLDESNLPAYLLAVHGTTDFVCMDAGTLLSGLRAARQKGAFADLPLKEDSKLSSEGIVLHHHIKAYLVTHPYLDHLEGLVVMSPNDNAKPIMGSEVVLKDLMDHVFNWHVWPNLCNTGASPAVGQYTYVELKHGVSAPIPGTMMSVRAFPLAHGNDTDSTAFLVEYDGDFVMYMGDTGPDDVEKRTTTGDLWRQVAPIIREGRLRGIFIETSYPDERPDDMLFSHLTPAWLMRAFRKLAELVDVTRPMEALSGFNVVIVHIKPDLAAAGDVTERVKKQLHAHNDLGLNLIFAEQGKPFEL